MSSSSADNESGADEDTLTGNGTSAGSHTSPREGATSEAQHAGGRILELFEEERDNTSTPEPLGYGINRYKETPQIDDVSEDGSSDALPRRPESPVDSIPDDSPSVQVMFENVSLKSLLTSCIGLRPLLSWRKQYIAISSFKARP